MDSCLKPLNFQICGLCNPFNSNSGMSHLQQLCSYAMQQLIEWRGHVTPCAHANSGLLHQHAIFQIQIYMQTNVLPSWCAKSTVKPESSIWQGRTILVSIWQILLRVLYSKHQTNHIMSHASDIFVFRGRHDRACAVGAWHGVGAAVGHRAHNLDLLPGDAVLSAFVAAHMLGSLLLHVAQLQGRMSVAGTAISVVRFLCPSPVDTTDRSSEGLIKCQACVQNVSFILKHPTSMVYQQPSPTTNRDSTQVPLMAQNSCTTVSAISACGHSNMRYSVLGWVILAYCKRKRVVNACKPTPSTHSSSPLTLT